ncbi:DUF4124 domain-containing protein [Marinobacter sp. M3C]|uniref:DUF4124 domain-containing protein n=1 Tax=Marinobacter sp. M3C TaxID=2917715 RepID=UPI00200C76D1|nr:DUF4124 domain-containing protein [Marinobacter sp. M3C]MCL1486985.1 DUF4124 domain-containing protein [Marinobacter sp.]UQG59125.1 DUF4124 domain-containing protein [Marinobacter sp. M3C]
MRPVPISITAMVVLLGLSGAAKADYYRWTDANGVTHFTDKPKTPGSQAIDFRRPTVIPIADNNRRRSDRLQGLQPEAQQSSVRPVSDDKTQKSAQSNVDQLARRKTCDNYADRIDNIESRLRAGGYSASRGNRLRRDRRELASKRVWECLRR